MPLSGQRGIGQGKKKERTKKERKDRMHLRRLGLGGKVYTYVVQGLKLLR